MILIWCKVVKAIHCRRNEDGFVPSKQSAHGVWNTIVSIQKSFEDRNINLIEKFCCKVGCGDTVRFWEDNWILAGRLKVLFPLLYQITRSKGVKVSECYKVVNNCVWWEVPWSRIPTSQGELSEAQRLWTLLNEQRVGNSKDTWLWLSQNKAVEFNVKTVRAEFLSQEANVQPLQVYRWNRIATPKVNCFVWRAARNRIATAETLALRGINLGNVMCSRCELEEESADHILVKCVWAKSLWWNIGLWVGYPDIKDANSIDQLLQTCYCLVAPKKVKNIVHAIVLLGLWKLWLCRNNKVFNNVNTATPRIMDEIKLESYWWVIKRGNMADLDKAKWWDFSVFDNG